MIKLLPLQGVLLIAIIPRAMPWARSFCPFRACCFQELLPFQGVLDVAYDTPSLPFTFALPFGQRFSIPFGR